MISIQANSAFSDALTRLGVHSLEEIYGETFEPFSYERPNCEAGEAQPKANSGNLTEDAIRSSLQARRVELQPTCDGSTVAAVDVSSRGIGWTGRGAIYALRGTIVWREEGAYRYLRCGPYLIHLKSTHFSPYGEQGCSLPTPNTQNTLERELQRYVCRSAKDAIILFDGCLEAALSGEQGALKKILDSAAGNRNTVIAVTKETNLSFSGGKITSFLEGLQSPCIIDLDDLVAEWSKPFRLFGRVFVGRMAWGGYGFRLDVDRRLTVGEAAEAVGRLMGNDLMVQGYPETLRLAHILSFFTPAEVIGLQRFLVESYGLTPSRTQPLRRLLFGPFGRGESA